MDGYGGNNYSMLPKRDVSRAIGPLHELRMHDLKLGAAKKAKVSLGVGGWGIIALLDFLFRNPILELQTADPSLYGGQWVGEMGPEVRSPKGVCVCVCARTHMNV